MGEGIKNDFSGKTGWMISLTVFFTLSKIKVRDIIKIIFIGFGVTEDRGQENAYS